jgi:hypothetical protein
MSVNFDYLRSVLLSFPEVKEEPHFDKISYRVKKKIVATYDLEKQQACLKLSVQDQEQFSDTYSFVEAVPNKWGNQGWTFVVLEPANERGLKELLLAAYREVAPKSLSALL